MIKLLYTGDWHLRGTNPRNRLDDYKEAVKAKLRDVFDLARKWEVKAILAPGDIWDRPEVSIGVLLEYVEVLKESPVEIITTIGNHDIYGYNVETYYRSSLKLLEMLVPQFTVIADPLQRRQFVDDLGNSVILSATPYSAKMDINGFGYDPGGHTEHRPEYGPRKAQDGAYRIHIAHGMLLDHRPPFDRYTLIQDAYTTADLVLTGHDHLGYGMYKRQDGVVFCNPGALTRLAASISEMERTVQVALISVDGREATINLVPLKTAKPGAEILDRSKIEAEKERAYAMDQFSALIQSKTGEAVLLDVNQIVEEIAKLEGAAPHVIKAALELIDQQREKVRP